MAKCGGQHEREKNECELLLGIIANWAWKAESFSLVYLLWQFACEIVASIISCYTFMLICFGELENVYDFAIKWKIVN